MTEVDLCLGDTYRDVSARDVETALSKTVFVIPSVNGGRLLDRMLPTLGLPSHIIYVLDQSSTDNTHAVCQAHGVNLVQLGERHTYTQCCNIALNIAHERNAEFVYISNNDITFVTDVGRELLHEMMSDDNLGVASCSQLIVDEKKEDGVLSNYVYWNLSEGYFEHNTSILEANYRRIETDFCEMTCSIIRTSAARRVGGFDNDFGFYHEDADFGFRLREMGYTSAYLPQSQIKHYAGSTFRAGLSDLRSAYIAKSKKLFMQKHLGFGVNYNDYKSAIPSSWTIVNKNLYKSLYNLGLIDPNRPNLVFSHPGERPFEYLYSVWETSRLPKEWLRYRDSYKSVFLPCRWNLESFRNDGFLQTHYVPLGVDTDTFHPYGASERRADGPTFLWFSRSQYRKGFDVLMRAWPLFKKRRPTARLLVMGHGILSEAAIPWAQARRWREYAIYDDRENGITYKEIIDPLSDDQVAAIYRSVDCVLVTSRSEGFGFNVVEALACGTMVIFPEFGSTADMIFPGALTFRGSEVDADYSDKGFIDVGIWWEPDLESLLSAMDRAVTSSTAERQAIARSGINKVASSFTWRNTAFAMRAALKATQVQSALNRHRFRRPEKDIISWIVEEMFQGVAEVGTFTELLSSEVSEIFADFAGERYLTANPDVEKDGVDPLWHFILFGWAEDRQPALETSVREFLSKSREALVFLVFLHGIGLSASSRDARRMFADWESRKVIEMGETKAMRDPAFIRLVYKMILRRSPDASGLRRFMAFLGEEGRSRAELVASICASSEAESIRKLT